MIGIHMLRSESQAGKRDRRRSAHPPEQDQRVLLLLEDEGARGGAIPVIGRRLPSKSAPTRSSPVQGRRSHRQLLLMEQQLPSTTVFHYDNLQPLGQKPRRDQLREQSGGRRRAAAKPASRSLAAIPQPAFQLCSEPICCATEQLASSECLACATYTGPSALTQSLAPNHCMEPCCQPATVCAAAKPARSASCQRLPPPSSLIKPHSCCSSPAPLPASQTNRRRQSNHNNSSQHHDHRSCRANESSHRPSSCSERSYNHQPQGGRNVLPVQPKPSLDYSARLLVADYLSGQSYSPLTSSSTSKTDSVLSEEAAAVNQMYESLAAELKAKLANKSKTAPILLPPKDYDTLSRRQGKLNGIEQRRSTNPMLVGPAANRLLMANCNGTRNRKADISEHQQHIGRCERDSQRSRSNSSSGLGSISMGTGSPSNISPASSSSSSDDMCNSSPRHSVSSDEPHSMRDELPIAKTDRETNSDSGQSSTGTGGYNESTSGRHMSRNSADHTRHSNMSDSSVRSSTHYDQCDRRPAKQTTISGKRGQGLHNHNPSKVSDGILWNGRVEVPLKVNSEKNGNTYLATKQIIY